MNYSGESISNTHLGDVIITGDLELDGSLISGGGSALHITDTTQSTGIDTGALIVDGGVGIAKNLNVGGDMVVVGTITHAGELIVNDPLIKTGNANTGGDLVDLGVYSEYSDGSPKYSAMYRDHTDNTYKFKTNIPTEPTSTIPVSGDFAEIMAGAIDLQASTSGSIKFTPSATTVPQTYVLPASGAGLDGYVLTTTIGGTMSWAPVGDVVAPASATDDAVARYDGTTGKLIQNSLATLDDLGTLTCPKVCTDDLCAIDRITFTDAIGFYIDGGVATLSILSNTGNPVVYIGNEWTGGSGAQLLIQGRGGSTAYNYGLTVGGGKANNVLGSALGSFEWQDSSATMLANLSNTGDMTIAGSISLNGSTSGNIKLIPSATTTNSTYTLPADVPTTNGASLISQTDGTMSWTTDASVSSSSGSSLNSRVPVWDGSSGNKIKSYATFYAADGGNSLFITGSGRLYTNLISPATGSNISVGNNLIPAVSASYDLGSVSKRWGKAHIGCVESVCADDNIAIYSSTDGGNVYSSWFSSGVTKLNFGYDAGNNNSFLDAISGEFDIRFTGTEGYTFDNIDLSLKNARSIRFWDLDNSHHVRFKAHDTTTASTLYILPASDGSSGQQLTTDGSGNLSWSSAAASISINDLTNAYTTGTTGDILSYNAVNTVLGNNTSVDQGINSVVIGASASSLTEGTKGGSDVVIGWQAGYSLDHQSATDASSGNTLVGTSAGSGITSGINNVCLGNLSSVGALLDNQIAIGANVSILAANTCVIGDTNITSISNEGGKTCDLGTTSKPFGGIHLGGSTSGYIKLQSHNATSNTTYTFPQTLGSNGDVLTMNGGAGALTWSTPSTPSIGINDLTDGTAVATSGVILSINATNNCTVVGQSALDSLTSGTANTAIGSSALTAITTGFSNTAIGYLAGQTAVGQSGTVAVGALAYATADDAIAIGNASAASAADSVAIGVSSTAGYSNSTAVGANCSTVAIDSVALGDTGVTTVHPTSDNLCNLGAGSYRWKEVFAGNATINTSDLRYKEEIIDSDIGLDFITKLNPKKYCFKGDKQPHYGFVAQEVEELVKSTLKNDDQPKYKNKGIVHYDDKSDMYGIRYSELIAPMVSAIQELNMNLSIALKKIETLESYIEDTDDESPVLVDDGDI